jgi:uroporphyrinogen-III decarboxylase
LRTIEAIQPGEDTVWEIEPLIKDTSDVEKLLSVPYRFDPPDMSDYFSQRVRLGDKGVAICFVSTPLVMVSRLTGFQRFLEWSLIESKLIEKMISIVQERLAERLEFILIQGAGPVIRFGGSEQATPPMMSGKSFDRFILGFERPLWELVRQAGQIVWVHCHGRIQTVLDKYIDSGVQLLDPVEPPPLGDIEIANAKELSRRGPMTLIGNIEWSDLEYCQPDEIEAKVKRAILDGGKEFFILGSSAEVLSMPGDHLTENILRYIEAGQLYGWHSE